MEEKLYVMNPEQAANLRVVYDFFANYVKNEGGTITMKDITPENLYGEMNIEVDSIDFHKEYMKEFRECLPLIDTISIKNTGADTVKICVRVNDVWRASDE